MTRVEQLFDVLDLHRQGHSARAIIRRTELACNTVRRILPGLAQRQGVAVRVPEQVPIGGQSDNGDCRGPHTYAGTDVYGSQATRASGSQPRGNRAATAGQESPAANGTHRPAAWAGARKESA